MTNSFIFPAVAFPILCWAKNFFTVKSVFLRFLCTIVNRFGFFYFAAAPRPDFIRRGKRNFNLFKSVYIQQSAFSLLSCSVQLNDALSKSIKTIRTIIRNIYLVIIVITFVKIIRIINIQIIVNIEI